MEYVVLVTTDGMENLAKGDMPYRWQMQLIEAAEFGAYPEDYANRKPIARFTASFPAPAECIPVVLAQLKAKEQEIQAEAHEEMLKINERREQLLALPMSAPEVEPPSDFIGESFVENWRETATCICTGCSFTYNGLYWWGDLWRDGDDYLFNATSIEGHVMRGTEPYAKLLTAEAAPTRNDKVLRIPVKAATLSPELEEYIQ